mmetsp:Transcript_1707/g.2980  ORF Transcript_1707/g.2980 Transcript_1707/m.2980 type:complete len:225 (+) Transcript_1707:10-684(+)
MTTQLMEVSNIRFTQEHVYDTFNANSDRAGSVLDLMDSILSGEKTPWDIPLIRVAAKKGAYWCVDNRRLFTYKHLQLGKIPVQVFGWKENREFELKYRNGLPFRQQTSNGLRVGLIQRSDRAFPRSSVAEPALSKFQKLFTKAEQRKHEDKDADGEADASLKDLLQPSKAVRAKRKVRTCRGTIVGGKKRKVAPKIEEKDKKLTVTLDKEDSEEDDFAIEISAP